MYVGCLSLRHWLIFLFCLLSPLFRFRRGLDWRLLQVFTPVHLSVSSPVLIMEFSRHFFLACFLTLVSYCQVNLACEHLCHLHDHIVEPIFNKPLLPFNYQHLKNNKNKNSKLKHTNTQVLLFLNIYLNRVWKKVKCT